MSYKARVLQKIKKITNCLRVCFSVCRKFVKHTLFLWCHTWCMLTWSRICAVSLKRERETSLKGSHLSDSPGLTERIVKDTRLRVLPKMLVRSVRKWVCFCEQGSTVGILCAKHDLKFGCELTGLVFQEILTEGMVRSVRKWVGAPQWVFCVLNMISNLAVSWPD